VHIHGDLAEPTQQRADHRLLEELVAGQEPHRSAGPRWGEGDEGEVEVADVVAGEDHRPIVGDVLVPARPHVDE
jgi:hypothetical protein